MHATRQSSLNKNKVWYTASQVACGWAGAVMKKANQAFGQEQLRNNRPSTKKKQQKTRCYQASKERQTEKQKDRQLDKRRVIESLACD